MFIKIIAVILNVLAFVIGLVGSFLVILAQNKEIGPLLGALLAASPNALARNWTTNLFLWVTFSYPVVFILGMILAHYIDKRLIYLPFINFLIIIIYAIHLSYLLLF